MTLQELMNTFSARIREARGQVMQATFAKQIGVSRASLSAYENATRIPDIDTLRQIHEVTGVSLYYLLGLSDSKDEAFATAQRDTGLCEDALALVHHNPIIADCINAMAKADTLSDVCRVIATLYNDYIYIKDIPATKWTRNMEGHRGDTIRGLIDDLLDAIVAAASRDSAVQITDINEQKLPCYMAINFFHIINQRMHALQLLKEQGELTSDNERPLRAYRDLLSDENGNLPDQHLTWPITETFCQLPEVINPNGEETPE